MFRSSRLLNYAALWLAFVVTAESLPAQKEEKNRLRDADKVMIEVLGLPDDFPSALLDKAYCVIVLPSVRKAAILIGASYGRGVMACRGGSDLNRSWAAPAMVALEGVSAGLQLGGQATDLVLLVMNRGGAEAILRSRAKLGADVSISAGPIGRDTAAASDVTLHTEILSYSRSRGIFAGLSLEGSTLRPDGHANRKLYGKRISAKDIVLDGTTPAPPSARPLLATLNRASPIQIK